MNTRSHGLPITSEGPASRTRSSLAAEAHTGTAPEAQRNETIQRPVRKRRKTGYNTQQNAESSRQQRAETVESIPDSDSQPDNQPGVAPQDPELSTVQLIPRRIRPAARRNRVSILNSLRTSPGPDVQANEVEELSRSLLDPSIGAAAVLRFEDSGRVAQPGQGRRGEQGVISSGRVIPSTGPAPPRNQRATSTSQVKRSLKRKGGSQEVECKKGIASLRLLQEIQSIDEKIPPGCYAAPKADELHEWAAVIEGPADTVYAGGTFFCNITLPQDYPFNPPKVSFQTRIYHCNINAQGEVCLDVLGDKWDPTMDISMVLQSLLTLMYDCNPDDALVCPIGKQFKEDREQFDKTARMWTQRYAC